MCIGKTVTVNNIRQQFLNGSVSQRLFHFVRATFRFYFLIFLSKNCNSSNFNLQKKRCDDINQRHFKKQKTSTIPKIGDSTLQVIFSKSVGFDFSALVNNFG